jgi:hypothetical protein
MKVEQLALQRKRYAHLSDEEWRWMLQQVEGRQRTCDKLPTFAQIDDWWYPVRLSCEQCSSEITARYKASLLPKTPFTLTDLTGGYGVDTFFMSEHATQAHYVERNEELCRIASHNFGLTRPQLQIHQADAICFLEQMPPCDVIYLDPARRDQNGGKVFRLEDCEPNVVELLPTLTAKSKQLMVKLSPMLDITQALRSLPIPFDVHIVAVKNEVKEVLLIQTDGEPTIHALNLQPFTDIHPFSFTLEEEKSATPYTPAESAHNLGEADTTYIYEPNAAIIKAGAFKLVAQRFELCKMAPNTHLYFSNQLIENFPGRVWKIMEVNPKDTKNICASVLTRNYPLTPDQLRGKLKIKEGDQLTIIGARLGDKPTLFLCNKICTTLNYPEQC